MDVFRGANETLEITAVFHVAVAGFGHVVGADRFGVQHRLCHTGVGVKALEGVDVDVVHDGVVRVGKIHRVVGDLGARCVSALDVQAKRQSACQALVGAVNLTSERAQVSLDCSTC